MTSPVYVYYELNNYYQNHRRFVNSWSPRSLRADDITEVSMYMYMYVRLHVCTCTCMYMYRYVHVHVCMCICMYMYMYMYVHVCTCTCMYVFMFACFYIHSFIHVIHVLHVQVQYLTLLSLHTTLYDGSYTLIR